MDTEEEVKPKSGRFDEMRKTHPKAYMKWTAEEDASLLALYKEFKDNGSGDFEMFLVATSKDFGRKENGVRGHLAKFFTDIPGWDYAGWEKVDSKSKEKKAAKKAEAKEEVKAKKEKAPAVVFNTEGNPEAAEILHLLEETSKNIFFTGEAGTGKSTLLQHFRRTTQKNVIALAPTGVAALNIEGQTIHSFCAFGTDITVAKVKKLPDFSPKKKLLKNLHAIIIDEISMVRADLLDCVDKFLRINGYSSDMPFGGIQMIFVGDLYQLPPVEKDFQNGNSLLKEYVSPYFFDSRSFAQGNFIFRQLKTVYRQTDRVFLDVLNAVRNNAVSQQHLTILNKQAKDEEKKFTFEKFAIYLTTTNQRARQVNNFFLEKIDGEAHVYKGRASGTFEDREPPTDLDLVFKIGAQIMMLTNDYRKRWVNGTMGKIVGIEKAEKLEEETYAELDEGGEEGFVSGQSDENVVIVELETGERVYVEPHTWEMIKFVYDQKSKDIDSRATGTFTQYPFKLAWAVTIHKSQGKTFDKVYVDLATGTFAHGQLYVALSRCRTLEGLRLRRPIVPQDIVLDERVVRFLSTMNN